MPAVIDPEPSDGGEPIWVFESAALLASTDASSGAKFIAGDAYAIADIAAYPWIVPWKRQQQDFPNPRRWFNAARERLAAQRAYATGEPYASRPAVTEEGKKILFGQTAQTIQLTV